MATPLEGTLGREMRVLVLDGHQNQAVACVRSLSRQGHAVWVGESDSWSKAGLSRFCSGTFRYALPQKDPDQFLNDILQQCRDQPGTFVLPTTETTTLLLSAHRTKLFAAGARMVLPDHVDLLRAVDKGHTTGLAAALGIATPRTACVNSLADAQSVGEKLRFPVVLKPRSSQEVSHAGSVRTTGRTLYAADARQLEDGYLAMSSKCSYFLAQEFVEGTGTGYFALMNHGHLRAEFAHRRIRDVHPTGSGSALRESILPDPEIRRSSMALLQALNWHGVAMVEYRLRDDGIPVFLEVNGRFWHSLALPCFAGVDFPALMGRIAEAGDIDPVAGYRVGVRCRWLIGDFRHLVAVWKGKPAGYSGKFPGRLETLLAELTPTPGTFHDNFMLRDPLPEFGDWIRFARQVVTGR